MSQNVPARPGTSLIGIQKNALQWNLIIGDAININLYVKSIPYILIICMPCNHIPFRGVVVSLFPVFNEIVSDKTLHISVTFIVLLLRSIFLNVSKKVK